MYRHHCAWSSECHPALHPTPLKIALHAPNMKTRELNIPQMIGDMDFHVLFPDFMILLHRLGSSASYITNHFWPVVVDRTVREVCIPFQEPASVRERLQQEYFKCICRILVRAEATRCFEGRIAPESVHQGDGLLRRRPRPPGRRYRGHRQRLQRLPGERPAARRIA